MAYPDYRADQEKLLPRTYTTEDDLGKKVALLRKNELLAAEYANRRNRPGFYDDHPAYEPNPEATDPDTAEENR